MRLTIFTVRGPFGSRRASDPPERTFCCYTARPAHLQVGASASPIPDPEPESWHDGPMWIGWIEFDLLLGDVQSLKEKRAIVRPLIADLSRRTEAAVAEVASHDLHRRAGIGVSVVASGASHVRDVLDRAERTVVDHPEVTLLSAHRGLHSSDD